MIGIESDRADFNSLSGNIFLFELAGDVSFDKGSLSNAAVSDENNFKFSNNVDIAIIGSLNC
jgi:hypothetical protein